MNHVSGRSHASPSSAALALLALAALACNLAGPSAVPPTELPATAAAPTATAPPQPEATPLRPMPSERPLVWFAPLPPMPTREDRPFIGSDDFMNLFSPDAPWPQAAGHIQVFKWYAQWPAQVSTDEELRQAVSDLNRRGVALALELGPLEPTAACGIGVEGSGGLTDAVNTIHRIQQAGGVVRLIAFDEPYAFGHLYDGPNACHWPAEKVAQKLGEFIQGVDSLFPTFPKFIIGDIEPLWAGLDAAEYEHWLETFRQVNGDDLDFFHVDSDFTRPDWAQTALELEHFSRDRGLEFGIIYFGDSDDTGDAQWLGKAEARMVEYEAVFGGRPDHVIIQSWNDHPDRVLPETDPETFTHLVNRYFRARTALTVELQQPGDGSASLSGVLAQADGTPLAGAPVELRLLPHEGNGVYFEYTVSGTVPEGASVADVGYRVNDECGCSGASDFSLYRVSYTEGGEGASRAPNGDFSQGLNGWGMWGDGQAQLGPSDHGPGRMLHIVANPGQAASANSGLFPVTSGAAFTVTFAARVSPASAGSGYFSLVFLNGDTEVSRVRVLLEAAAVPLGTATTGDDGSYQLALDQPPGAGNSLEAAFAGDDQYWPAFAEAAEP